MINKKLIGWSAVAFPITILALVAFNRHVIGSDVFENVLGLLVFPVIIYNHFTHAKPQDSHRLDSLRQRRSSLRPAVYAQ